MLRNWETVESIADLVQEYQRLKWLAQAKSEFVWHIII